MKGTSTTAGTRDLSASVSTKASAQPLSPAGGVLNSEGLNIWDGLMAESDVAKAAESMA